MRADIQTGDLARFRSAVEDQLGFHFEADEAELSGLLERRVAEVGDGGVEAYLSRLRAPGTRREETLALAEYLTVGETYFFRHPQQFSAFSERVLPDRLAAHESDRRLRVLSVGCSSGEEPYTLALLIRDRLGAEAWDVTVVGADVNRKALQRARAARYGAWSLRGTPESLQRRHFRREGHELVLDPDVSRMVTFVEANLMQPDPRWFSPEAYDVVFCRNVLIYFSEAAIRLALEHLEQVVAPGGFLFLGSAESARGLPAAFTLQQSHEVFYYRKAAVPGARPVSPPEQDAPAGEPAPEPPPAPAPVAPERPAAPDLEAVLRLFCEEKFAEALARLEGCEAPRARLLRAAALSGLGRVPEADGVCGALLAEDPGNAEAHYLAALCREGLHDVPGAQVHDRQATALDASFGLPHLHLGLIALRERDAAVARGELSEALRLLPGEDADRILLFGGGFTRDALLQLCRAGLDRCGGAR